MMAELFDCVVPVREAPPVFSHGVLNVLKPAGWTSHDVVAKVRGLLQRRKVGHAGTLDPAATGVLPLLIGKGTRLSEFLVHWDKEYQAVLRLGQETTTQDATGEVIRTVTIEGLHPESVCTVIKEFRGVRQQVPPMYSAVKMNGQPLYKAARAGKTLDRQARSITIYEIAVTALDLPSVALRIRCSKGTYIRTICADIGQRLGVGGHLSRLTRVRVGPLHVDQALTLSDLVNGGGLVPRPGSSLSLDEALAHLPAVIVDSDVVPKVLNGGALPNSGVWLPPAVGDVPTGTSVRVKDGRGRLLALGQWRPSKASLSSLQSSVNQLQMIKVFGENA